MRWAWPGVGLALLTAAGLSAQPPLPSFDDVIGNLVGVNAALQSFRAEMGAEARFLIFRYRLSATVYAARPAKYRVIVHNPPWFLRPVGSDFAHVARPEDVLVNYTPRGIDWKDEGGRRMLYLDLLRRTPVANPPRVEAFVDPERWLIERTVLHYEWGTVFVESRYEVIGGFVLPSMVKIRLPRYFIETTLWYQDYQLSVDIPDSIFSTK